MGALKKIFGLNKPESHEDEILKGIKEEHTKVLHMSETLRHEIQNIEARLHKVWKIYQDKRADNKPIPRDFIERIHDLEQQLGLEEKKIEKEIVVEAQDISAVASLLENLENTVNGM